MKITLDNIYLVTKQIQLNPDLETDLAYLINLSLKNKTEGKDQKLETLEDLLIDISNEKDTNHLPVTITIEFHDLKKRKDQIILNVDCRLYTTPYQILIYILQILNDRYPIRGLSFYELLYDIEKSLEGLEPKDPVIVNINYIEFLKNEIVLNAIIEKLQNFPIQFKIIQDPFPSLEVSAILNRNPHLKLMYEACNISFGLLGKETTTTTVTDYYRKLCKKEKFKFRCKSSRFNYIQRLEALNLIKTHKAQKGSINIITFIEVTQKPKELLIERN